MLPDRFLQSSFILNVGLVPGRAWLELSVPYIDCNGDVFRDFEYIDDTNMQFPVHFGFGGFSISAHFVFETLAFIIGFRYFLYLRKKVEDPISEGNRIWILIAAAAGALIFSRLLGSLESPQAWFSSDHPLLHFYASKTIVGGLLGGLLCVEVTKYYLGVRTSSGDLFTYPLILAMMIGRIGCFSSGVYEPTYGVQSTLPWALDLGVTL
jgi:prolipoprotein diacylglyceryltransferase